MNIKTEMRPLSIWVLSRNTRFDFPLKREYKTELRLLSFSERFLLRFLSPRAGRTQTPFIKFKLKKIFFHGEQATPLCVQMHDS